MLPELSLHVLDICENAVYAKASLIEVLVEVDIDEDRMMIRIADNGAGMSKEQIAQVTDPFYTTRTTRKIGLGVPFFKQACEQTGGSLVIDSAPGRGTTLTATLTISSIDRMPLGDMTSTVHALITTHEDIDFCYRFRIVKEDARDKETGFDMDTREMRTLLAGVPFHTPEVSLYIKDYLRDNMREAYQAAGIRDL